MFPGPCASLQWITQIYIDRGKEIVYHYGEETEVPVGASPVAWLKESKKGKKD